jgi:3-oxoacyl-[acyl-carrier protein] reductase
MELSGKNALVTGASRGIGRGIALALAEEGANVAVNYLKNKELAQSVVEAIQQKGGSAIVVQADVSEKTEVENMVKDVLKEFTTLDILVNNAAVATPGRKIDEIDEKEWDRVINVNLKGVYNCCRAIVPHMISRQQGRIVNMSSIAGLRGSGSIAYAASKAGIIGITMSLARELVDFGITVNAVAPGLVDTEMPQLTEEQKRNIKQEVPIGWIGQPEHIAHSVLFLLTNDYVTGHTVNISGGRLISI